MNERHLREVHLSSLSSAQGTFQFRHLGGAMASVCTKSTQFASSLGENGTGTVPDRSWVSFSQYEWGVAHNLNLVLKNATADSAGLSAWRWAYGRR